MSEKFGVYIHIPYCLQRCTYCDFATYVHSEIIPPSDYIELVRKEISYRKNLFHHHADRQLSTVYFGGGTPSLIASEHIVDLISELNKHGFHTGPETEITIEINPATIDEKKLEHYLSAGVNRFSVGAQTFHDRLLKMVKREHNADQTKQTLALLKKYNLNFSFDLLFALPTQTLEELKNDVEMAVEIGSKHVSPYCLTVPESHPLSKNRPLDEEQIDMFNVIDEHLTKAQFYRYEISNYAQPGFESRHNQLYWNDSEYWGLGLSAHSYRKKSSAWGERFWNLNNIDLYKKQISHLSFAELLPIEQREILEKNQALTDFCHTSLRTSDGLSRDAIHNKFDAPTWDKVAHIAEDLIQRGLLMSQNDHLKLTANGILISNQIFEKFTFLSIDIS